MPNGGVLKDNSSHHLGKENIGSFARGGQVGGKELSGEVKVINLDLARKTQNLNDAKRALEKLMKEMQTFVLTIHNLTMKCQDIEGKIQHHQAPVVELETWYRSLKASFNPIPQFAGGARKVVGEVGTIYSGGA